MTSHSAAFEFTPVGSPRILAYARKRKSIYKYISHHSNRLSVLATKVQSKSAAISYALSESAEETASICGAIESKVA